jgi:hypothetical protein
MLMETSSFSRDTSPLYVSKALITYVALRLPKRALAPTFNHVALIGLSLLELGKAVALRPQTYLRPTPSSFNSYQVILVLTVYLLE